MKFASSTDLSVIALGKAGDELVDVGLLGSILDFGPGGLGVAEPDVFPDGPAEQSRLLANHGALPPEPLEVQVPDVHAADHHRTAEGVVEPLHQPHHRRLAAAARSDVEACVIK